MKNRLLAFGCSYTYGQGLSDCWDSEKLNYGPTPSKLAWPNLVGEQLDCEVYNYGIPGASNKHIWHTILNTEFQKSDIVIVLWSYSQRHCFFKNDNSIQRMLFSDIGRKYRFENRKWKPDAFLETKFYYENFYSELDSIIESVNKINHVNYYLKSQGIKSYHFSVEDTLAKNDMKWNETKITHISFDYTLGLALDKMHPSEAGQKRISQDILLNI